MFSGMGGGVSLNKDYVKIKLCKFFYRHRLRAARQIRKKKKISFSNFATNFFFVLFLATTTKRKVKKKGKLPCQVFSEEEDLRKKWS